MGLTHVTNACSVMKSVVIVFCEC